MKKEINWDKIPNGTSFTCCIYKHHCKGKIFKGENYVYLCQNIIAGSPSPDMLGYQYSWEISKSSSLSAGISNFILYTIDNYEIY